MSSSLVRCAAPFTWGKEERRIADSMPFNGLKVRASPVVGSYCQVLASLKRADGQQRAARGDLSWRVGSALLQPPGDGFHKQRGHEVWHKLI